MATRTVHLPEGSYELLAAEAQRRGVAPDALADELLRAEIAPAGERDLQGALGDLAALRARLPVIDGLALALEARAELERRG